MELIENPQVDPRWVDPNNPDSGRVVAHSSDARWAVVRMGFNWRLVGLEESGCYSFGWCYQDRLAALVAVAVWEPEFQDEPLGWHKRAGGVRRAPHREGNPMHNRPRCAHGTYLDAPHCGRVQVCPDFPGVRGPSSL